MKQQAGSARRYAQALFEIAVERGSIDQWAAELARVAELVSDPTAGRLLASPTGSTQAKRRVIDTAAGPLSREVGRLVDILLERKRMLLFPGLADAFADLVRQHRGILRADVTTAVALDDAAQRVLSSRLEQHFGKAIEIHSQVVPSILGGVIARVGDQLIEGSVRGRLERLRESLKGRL